MKASQLLTVASLLATSILAQQTGNVEIYDGLVFGTALIFIFGDQVAMHANNLLVWL